MDFPIFKEIRIDSEKLSNFEEYFEGKNISNSPTFIDVDSISADETELLVQKLNNYSNIYSVSFDSPYPLYLAGRWIKFKNYKWRNFVYNRDELPIYFRRRIFLKNYKQIKKLKNYDIYQYGIKEQPVKEINNRLEELNKTWFELKKERIQNLKLNKIICSFEKE